ncbi:MAG: GatB/YqeY domain-containing protein [Chloroflexota bacterium]
MLLKQQIKSDLKSAMKARDREQVTVLRVLLGEIDNAEAVDASLAADHPKAIEALPVGKQFEVPRRLLTEADIEAILQRELDERLAMLETYTRLGQTSAAQALQLEANVIARYLTE